MNKKELLHCMLAQYFIIYTASMFATLLLCGLAQPDVTLPLDYLWQVALFSLGADLPCLVYYSKGELSRRQWWVRTALHTLLLETVLMAAGFAIGMYRGFWGGAAFVFVILAVDMFVRFISYLSDRHTADEINEQLKRRRSKA